MNVNMDEFIVVSRSSHILFTLMNNGTKTKHIDSDNDVQLSELKAMIPVYNTEAFWDTDSRLNIPRNLKFLLEGAIPGLVMSSFVLARVDHSLENIFMLNFPHTRRDNGEIVDVKLSVIITETDVLLIAPFNCPGLSEINTNPYLISILKTSLLDIDHTNKVSILDILDRKDESGVSYGEKLLKVVDTMATDIHMQCEYFLKSHAHVQDSEYKVITEEDKEFEHIYGKYKDAIEFNVDGDDIAVTDFMPIIISSDEVNKTLCAEHKYNQLAGRVESRIIGCETYEDLNFSTASSIREVLIRCPENNVPKVIKLPYNIIYIGYNCIVTESDTSCFHELLTVEAPILSEAYIPGDITIAGTEGIDKESIKHLYASLKQFGIAKSSKIQELLYPLFKLPKDVARSAMIAVKSVFYTSAKMESEQSEVIREKMLNDELDTMTDRIDTIFKTYVMLVAISFVVGGFFIGIIVWLIMKGRIKNNKLKSFERVERRLVSIIKEYETKINFANQESDYKSVKNLTRTMDTYKMMLDKLREVKKDAQGKEEKFTDTYKEYQD